MGRWYLGIGETLWITLCTTRLVIGAILGEIGGTLFDRHRKHAGGATKPFLWGLRRRHQRQSRPRAALL